MRSTSGPMSWRRVARLSSVGAVRIARARCTRSTRCNENRSRSDTTPHNRPSFTRHTWAMCRSVIASAASNAVASGDSVNGAFTMHRAMGWLRSASLWATSSRRSRRVKIPMGAWFAATTTMLPTCCSCMAFTASLTGKALSQFTGWRNARSPRRVFKEYWLPRVSAACRRT